MRGNKMNSEIQHNTNDELISIRLQTVGAILAKARRHRGMTLNELGDVTGIHRTSISRIENGHQNLDISTLKTLAEGLKFNPRTLSDGILRALDKVETVGVETAVDDFRLPGVDPEADNADARRVIGMGQIPISNIVAGGEKQSFEFSATSGDVIDLTSVEAAEVKDGSMSPLIFNGQKILFVRKWPKDGQLCICSIGGRQVFKRYYERIETTVKRGTRVIITLVNVSQDPGERPMPELEINEIEWCYTVVGTWLI
ncbi:MAG: helix-turn-helix domain-containing protein [Planctomycetota bacterium]